MTSVNGTGNAFGTQRATQQSESYASDWKQPPSDARYAKMALTFGDDRKHIKTPLNNTTKKRAADSIDAAYKKKEGLEASIKHYEATGDTEKLKEAKEMLAKLEHELGLVLGAAQTGNNYEANLSMDRMDGIISTTPAESLAAKKEAANVNAAPATPAEPAPVTNEPKTTGSGDVSSPKSSTTSRSSSSSNGDLMSMSGGEVASLMRKDSKKFAAMMKELDPEEQMAINQKIQHSIQSMNRIFSMLTNLMKSDHDTAKAIINNMRV